MRPTRHSADTQSLLLFFSFLRDFFSFLRDFFSFLCFFSFEFERPSSSDSLDSEPRGGAALLCWPRFEELPASRGFGAGLLKVGRKTAGSAVLAAEGEELGLLKTCLALGTSPSLPVT